RVDQLAKEVLNNRSAYHLIGRSANNVVDTHSERERLASIRINTTCIEGCSTAVLLIAILIELLSQLVVLLFRNILDIFNAKSFAQVFVSSSVGLELIVGDAHTGSRRTTFINTVVR